MSERQAKKLRKEQVKEVSKKSADKGKIMFYVISTVVVLGFAGLAGYSIANELKSAKVETSTEATTEATTPDTSTLSGYAEAMGMTYDDMVAKYGLNAETFTADMPTDQAMNLFTLENFAAMSEKDIETFKTEVGIPADVDTTIPNTELATSVMMKVNGYPYTIEELREYGLAAEITEETKWADAQEAVMNAATAKYSAEAAEAEAEAPAEGEVTEEAPAEETTTEEAETSDGGAE